MEKRIVLLLIVLASTQYAVAQDRSFGLRLGNPIGITYKQYTQTRKAFEFILGTSASGWGKNYYENSFYHRSKYDGYTYRSHQVSSTIHLGARYLLQYEIPTDGMNGDLSWYWGLGGFLRYSRVEYSFYDDDIPNNIRTDTRTNFDLGLDGIGGIEYTFEDTPLTVFGELNLALELLDRPFALHVFGAVGVRVRF